MCLTPSTTIKPRIKGWLRTYTLYGKFYMNFPNMYVVLTHVYTWMGVCVCVWAVWFYITIVSSTSVQYLYLTNTFVYMCKYIFVCIHIYVSSKTLLRLCGDTSRHVSFNSVLVGLPGASSASRYGPIFLIFHSFPRSMTRASYTN